MATSGNEEIFIYSTEVKIIGNFASSKVESEKYFSKSLQNDGTCKQDVKQYFVWHKRLTIVLLLDFLQHVHISGM